MLGSLGFVEQYDGQVFHRETRVAFVIEQQFVCAEPVFPGSRAGL